MLGLNGPSFGVCVPCYSLSAWYTHSFFPTFFCAVCLDCPFNTFFNSACACLDCPFNTFLNFACACLDCPLNNFLNSACAWLKWSFSYKKLYLKLSIMGELFLPFERASNSLSPLRTFRKITKVAKCEFFQIQLNLDYF